MFRLNVLLLCPLFLLAQAPDDVRSPDSILAATYDTISGPAGKKIDWDRLRFLFVPNAVMTSARRNAQAPPFPQSSTIEDYIKRAQGMRDKTGFYEIPIAHRVNRFGDVAHVFDSYEIHRETKDGPVIARGVNSYQLLFTGGRWWIVSLVWDTERPDNPLPQ